MEDQEALATVAARLEQAECALRDALSLLHSLADRLDKLERAVRLIVCAQLYESESERAEATIERLPRVSTRGRRAGKPQE